MSEIWHPWEFSAPPAQDDPAFLDWLGGELAALIKSGGSTEWSLERNNGYIEGLKKALALTHPHNASSGGAWCGPKYVNEVGPCA